MCQTLRNVHSKTGLFYGMLTQENFQMKKQIGYIYPNKFLLKSTLKEIFHLSFCQKACFGGYTSPGSLWDCFPICKTRPAQSNDFSFIFLPSFICGQFFTEAGQGHIQRERLLASTRLQTPSSASIRTVILSFISYIISMQNFHLE